MEDKTPEDVAYEKMLKRSRSAYDKAMPEADTTFKRSPLPPGTTIKDLSREGPSESAVKKIPGRVAPENTLDDLVKNKMRPSKDMKFVPLRKGGSVSSASKRADGIAQRGKTKGTMIMCGGGYMKGK